MAQHDPFSPQQFMELGFAIRGFDGWKDQSEASSDRDFVALYGTRPPIFSILWDALRNTTREDSKLLKEDTPKHLLLFYRWMKRYETELELRTSFCMSLENVRNTCRRMARAVSNLKAVVVSLLSFGVSFFFSSSHLQKRLIQIWRATWTAVISLEPLMGCIMASKSHALFRLRIPATNLARKQA